MYTTKIDTSAEEPLFDSSLKSAGFNSEEHARLVYRLQKHRMQYLENQIIDLAKYVGYDPKPSDMADEKAIKCLTSHIKRKIK